MTAVGRVLIVVHNLPVPFDRRVWHECRALRAAGFAVSVVCPKGGGDPAFAELEGVRLRKYTPPRPGSGPLSFAWEFGWSMFRTIVLVARTACAEGFDVIQVCNPPDTYVPLVAPLRLLGRPVVFDQHDLSPEIFSSRYNRSSGALLRTLLLCERMSYALASHVVTTNESYRTVALRRGKCRPQDVTVVRNGPDTTRMRPTGARAELRHGRRYLCCYLGIMGPQDGVDLLLRAFAVLVHDRGRQDCHLALLGYGESFAGLRELARSLDLLDLVTFTGKVDDATIEAYLSTADLGLCPDPYSPLNDASTMIKVMEYLAYGLPVVAFDLKETRVSAQDAAVYVDPGDVGEFADAVAALLDDPIRRRSMAAVARKRAVEVLDWRLQARQYVGLYRSLLSPPSAAAGSVSSWRRVRSAVSRRNAPACGGRTGEP